MDNCGSVIDSWDAGAKSSSVTWTIGGVGEGWLSDGSTKQRSGTEQRGGTEQRSGTCGKDWRSDCNWSGVGSWSILVDISVESVDGVSGVVYGPNGTVGFSDGVRSLDDISVTGFSLSLGVSGESVIDGVTERIRWVWVVLFNCSTGYGNWSMGDCDWCVCDSERCMGDSNWSMSDSSDWSSISS